MSSELRSLQIPDDFNENRHVVSQNFSKSRYFELSRMDLSVIDTMKNPRNGCAYSDRSKDTYRKNFKIFLKYLNKTNQAVCEDSIRSFLDHIRKNLSVNTFTGRKNAIMRVLENQIEIKTNWEFRERLKSFFKDFVPPKLDRSVHENKYLSYYEVEELISYGKNSGNVPIQKRRLERMSSDN